MRGIILYVKMSCVLLCVGGNVAAATGSDRSARSKSGKDMQGSKSSKNPMLVSEVSTGLLTHCCQLTCIESHQISAQYVLVRKEKTSYVDGISAMDLNRPNARDVSNAFGSTFKENSFGA
jgi:hypothetical protein